MRKARQFELILVVTLAALAGTWAAAQDDGQTPIVDVIVPELGEQAVLGKAIFDENCAACHGLNGAGNEGNGPPLIHKIYEPSHHGDMSFLIAVQNGVRAHHWRFGSMPPVKGVTQEDVILVVDYIRTVQRANGID